MDRTKIVSLYNQISYLLYLGDSKKIASIKNTDSIDELIEEIKKLKEKDKKGE